jgi:hypothetical protein
VIAQAFEEEGIRGGLHVRGLSGYQHARLMDAFQCALPVGSYQLSFDLSVLLGELFHDAGSLEVLTRLRKASDVDVRDTVAHALQHFAVECPDAELRKAAYQALREMSDDVDEGLRANVAYWVDNVENGRVY